MRACLRACQRACVRACMRAAASCEPPLVSFHSVVSSSGMSHDFCSRLRASRADLAREGQIARSSNAVAGVCCVREKIFLEIMFYICTYIGICRM